METGSGLSALEALRAKLNTAPAVATQTPPHPDAADLADDHLVCHCTNVSAGELRQVIHEGGASSLEEVQRCTRAGGSCGKCVPLLTDLVELELRR